MHKNTHEGEVKLKMKIVGTATCPIGYYAGHDADECRANQLDNGNIRCYACGTDYPKFSKEMKAIWAAICMSGFNAPSVKLGSEIQPGTPEYNASCLCGYDPAQSDRVQATFTREGQCVRLDYERSNEVEVSNPDRSLHRSLTWNELEALPYRVVGCVDGLIEHGFCLRHVDLEKGRVVMSCGRPVGTMGYVIGVMAELTWPLS